MQVRLLVRVLDDLLEIVESSTQDLTWAGYWMDHDGAVTDLRDHRDRLRRGDTSELDMLKVLFNPGMPLQDMAMASGWTDRYHLLAARFDRAAATGSGS
jgi:hypothetical protein